MRGITDSIARSLVAAGIMGGGGGGPIFPFSQDFSANASLGGWIIPGSAAVVGGALVITPTMSAEKVANGVFDSDTVWSTGVGWAIVGGVATHSGATGSNLSQTVADTQGNWLLLAYTIASRTVSYMDTVIGGVTGQPRSTNASFVEALHQAAAGTTLYLRAVTNFDGSVDNVSLKTISLPTMSIYRRCTQAAYRILVDPATINPGTPFGCVMMVDNPANPANMIAAYHDGVTTLKLTKRVAGTVTTLVTQTIAYDAAKKVEIRKNGTTYQLFYGNTQYGADQTVNDATIINNQYCGVLSVYAGNSIATVEIVANP